MLHNDTVTIFNRYVSGDEITWYPHVLKNVHMDIDRASLMAKFGAQSSDNVYVSIPFHRIDKQIMVGELPYYPPKEWSGQVNESLPGSLTLNDDSMDFDFMIEGEYEENPINDEEYGMYDGFYNYMNTKKDHCYKITSVNGPYKLIPHFEILAR